MRALPITALAVSGAFFADTGIAGASWASPPYLEVGIASLVALLLLVPHVRGVRPATGR